MTFNEKLISLRKSKGWSQEQLGEAVGASRQTVSKWELGVTTPEMNKLIELSDIFEISIDELVGKSSSEVKQEKNSRKYHYEYKSKTHIGTLPLVHINVGLGQYKAKGIISIGNISVGLLSIGIMSLGLLSIGVLALGLLALGTICGGIISAAGISVGVISLGGISIGIFAVGGVAVGVYSIGGCAIALNIAMGGFACGEIAIGDVVKGTYLFETDSNFELINSSCEQIRDTISTVLPKTPKIITDIFCLTIK